MEEDPHFDLCTLSLVGSSSSLEEDTLCAEEDPLEEEALSSFNLHSLMKTNRGTDGSSSLFLLTGEGNPLWEAGPTGRGNIL